MNRLRPGVVVWAHVTFADGTGEKTRPAVVVGTRGREVVVHPVTSSSRRHGFPQRYVELEDLAAAGVTRPCAVSVIEVVIDRIEVISVVGALSDVDGSAVFPAGPEPADRPLPSGGVDGAAAPLLALAC